MTSVDSVDKSFARRLALNHAILKNKYWRLPVDNAGHENYMPVGRGARTSEVCGRFVGFDACTNIAGHDHVFVEGMDCTGKGVLRLRHLWCHKASCPVCFNRGWSVREAQSIVGRVKTGEKRGMGLPEHITVSVSVIDRNLSEAVLRAKCRKALLDRGIEAGCMIFHGFRESKEHDRLVWSPHYHSIAFCSGRQKCRDCHKVCAENEGCGGFVDRNYRCGEVDGYLVKVHDKRKTIFGTAWYQLNHATLRIGLKRFYVVTWFGACGCRKFRTELFEAEVLCPACNEEMHRAFYVGKQQIVKDVGASNYVSWVAVDLVDEAGEPTIIEVIGGRGSKSE